MAFGGENAESYYDEGLTASMKGDLAHAVECFERAIRLDNSLFAAYHQLGKCYLRQGRGEDAVNLLQQVVDYRPKLVPARLDLGYALLAQGRDEDARPHFAEIVAAHPTNARAHLGLAQLQFQEGDWAGAVRYAQDALVHSGPNFSALFLLGRAAKLAGESALAQQSLGQASALMEKSIELNPEQPEGYYLRGEVNFVQEQFSTALERYRSAQARAEPDCTYSAFGESFSLVDIFVKQALCYQRLGKMDRARALGQEICRIDPEHKLGRDLCEL